MNKSRILAIVICLALPFPGQAQKIKSLVPWSFAPEGIEMGMSGRDLKVLIPDIKPLLGMFDIEQANIAEVLKDGLYSSRPGEGGYNEAMAYGISGGRLTQVYWSSRKLVTPTIVKAFREKFREMHGEPKSGDKAKVTKDGIARLTTEVFTVKDSTLAISLSSALGETEIAVLDTADPKIDLNQLYFSFEKQRERLRQELLDLTKKEPKDEADCLDVLKEVIAAQKAEAAQGRTGQPIPPSNDPGLATSATDTRTESAAMTHDDAASAWKLKLLAALAVSLFVLVGVFVMRRIGGKRN